MAPTSIMLIRHGEKPIEGGPQGVQEDGTQNSHELIARGWQRAGALARFFMPLVPAPNPVLPVPTALFAPAPDSDDESVRAWHLLLPLARLMNLEIQTDFGVGDEDKLADALLAQEGVLLIAWEHKRIRDIVSHVTNDAIQSPHWPGHRFDMVFLLSGTPNWTLQQVPQLLLDGDSDEPFPDEPA